MQNSAIAFWPNWRSAIANTTLTGYLVVLASSFFFCIQNVLVRVLFIEQTALGIGPIGGYLPPTLANSFLLLLLRMVVAVPLMAAFSQVLYPRIWHDLAQIIRRRQYRLGLHLLTGGALMFLYLALLYLSLGLIATGVAMTLFFTFPVFTALFSWRFFGVVPSRYRWGIMALVMVGSILTVPPEDMAWGNSSGWGIAMGVGSGVAYALYTVNAQKTFEVCHPVPFTWVSFALTLLLSLGALGVNPGSLTQTDLAWGPLWIGSALSGGVTFAGHLLYNLGIRQVGATAAAMIGSANPALTVLLAWVAIRETLQTVQVVGVLLVTGSVAALSGERTPSRSS
jgi:drug/metabolite transporter (DMT)-like permease